MDDEYEQDPIANLLRKIAMLLIVLGIVIIVLWLLVGKPATIRGADEAQVPAATRYMWDYEGCRCSEDVFNCGDPEALRCFEVCQRSWYFDPHGLDRDLDGIACSGGTQ